MFFEMYVRSKALGKSTQLNVLLPNDLEGAVPPYKTLWLLHGLSGDHASWMRNTLIERYALKYHLAVVMPNADRSWYTNTAYGVNYFDYVTEELPEICRSTFKNLSEKREDNIVAGLSMGGYGALKSALTLPERYGTCISLSGSLDVTRKGRQCNLEEWRSLFGFDMKSPLELEGSKHDLFALAEKAKKEGKLFPKLYLWCGLDDACLSGNQALDKHLTDLSVEHTFKTSEGDHSWYYWNVHMQNALDWALDD